MYRIHRLKVYSSIGRALIFQAVGRFPIGSRPLFLNTLELTGNFAPLGPLYLIICGYLTRANDNHAAFLVVYRVAHSVYSPRFRG